MFALYLKPLLFIIFQLGLTLFIAQKNNVIKNHDENIFRTPWNYIDVFCILILLNLPFFIIVFGIKSITWIIVFSYFIPYFFIFLFVMYLSKYKYHFSLKELGWSCSNIKEDKTSIPRILLVVFLFEVILPLLKYYVYRGNKVILQKTLPITLVEVYQSSFYLFIILSIIIIIIGPIVEELCFRGILFTTFLKKLNAKWAIVSSTVIFVAFHHAVDLKTTIISYIFVFLYYKRRSLLCNVLLHSGINLVNVVLFLFIMSS